MLNSGTRPRGPAKATVMRRLIWFIFVPLLSCTTTSAPDLAGMSFSGEPLIGKAIWHDLVTEDPATELPMAQRYFLF